MTLHNGRKDSLARGQKTEGREDALLENNVPNGGAGKKKEK